MLVEICGDYFNVDDICHIWVESDSIIVVEVRSGSEYFLKYIPNDSKNVSVHEYLKQIINGINMAAGRLTVGTHNTDWE